MRRPRTFIVAWNQETTKLGVDFTYRREVMERIDGLMHMWNDIMNYLSDLEFKSLNQTYQTLSCI